MGGSGGIIGGLLSGTLLENMVYGAHKDAKRAQEEAMRKQAEAQERAAKIQEQQAAAKAAREEQATNKANAEIVDASAEIDKTPTVTNSSNLTGSLGVPNLNSAGGATLGSSLLNDLMDDELKTKS